MSECPKCHQTVDAQALECPYCRTALKAYGHPGMKLYRATGSDPLCLSCWYHADDTCNFPKRPDAMDCTLYRDRAQPLTAATPGYAPGFQLKAWLSRNLVWVAVVGLILLSLLIALVR